MIAQLIYEYTEALPKMFEQKKIDKTYVRIDPDWQGCEFKYKGWQK